MNKEKGNNKIINKGESSQNNRVLRCINIDCVFNGSNQYGGTRNTCSHPKVIVESSFADITIAICSEFRSKKDYRFEKPAALINLKTGEKTELTSAPELGVTPVEKVTTEELEQSIAGKGKKHEQTVIPLAKPQVFESMPEPVFRDISIQEKYNLTDNPKNDFLILKKLYQPYTKKGFIGSVIVHLILLLLIWQILTPKNDQNGNSLQRIVVVEDLNMPKFDPPDIDKMKEEERKAEEEEKTDVRPNIIPKKIVPRINRPSTTEDDADTNKSITKDTSSVAADSLITQRDTTRYFIPDSLRTTFSENEVGLSIGYEKTEWNLIDSRTINSNQNFTGVILGIDSTKDDFKAVTIIVNLDNPEHPVFNKAVYKNIFAMDDSNTIAYVTDQQKMSAKKVQYKYYLFTDPTGKKNIQVTAEFKDEEILQKYQSKVDAIIRTIKIVVPPPPKTDM